MVVSVDKALAKVRSDLSAVRREFLSVVFLRNDVYELIVAETPDRGKTKIVRIDWTDRTKLKQIIYLRLRASVAVKSHIFDELWSEYFVEHVSGRETFNYFVDHCLMRPRFLIAIIENAIANAINRGHKKVNGEDCADAVLRHSYSILNDFGFEIRDVSHVSENIIHFIDWKRKYVAKGEVMERFERRS